MSKEIKKIFCTLALFALSGGLFYNFQELWMMDNNLSVRTIGIVFSLCSLITVSVIFLSSNLIKTDKIKQFCSSLLLVKSLILLSLFFLNHTGLNPLIKFLIMIDYALDTEIYACIYPMIAQIGKNDRTYAKKDLIYCSMYNTGVLITGFLIGKSIGLLNITYNSYVLFAGILSFISFLILLSVNLNAKKVRKSNVHNNILSELINIIRKDKISIIYLCFIVCGQISYNSVLGLTITLLTKGLSFSPSIASNIVVFMGIVSVILGIIVLIKLTFKNNYINLSIKYVVRAILYVLAVIFNNKWLFLIALMYPKIISESYSHITDAPYINRYEDEYQLAFINFRQMITYFGKAIGSLVCGIALSLNIRINFSIAAIFAILQAVFSFWALTLRNREKNDR